MRALILCGACLGLCGCAMMPDGPVKYMPLNVHVDGYVVDFDNTTTITFKNPFKKAVTNAPAVVPAPAPAPVSPPAPAPAPAPAPKPPKPVDVVTNAPPWNWKMSDDPESPWKGNL